MKVLLDPRGPAKVTSLLLMCLFVLKAAAYCPPPVNLGLIILTKETLLMSDFPDGTVITYECSFGYFQVGGSVNVSCVGGTWTGSDLSCQKMDCGIPKDRPHMSFEYPDGTLFGASIKVVCDKGYKMKGRSYLECYPAGWKGKSQCVVETCEKPGEVANGRTSWVSASDPEYGDVIHYFCHEGYYLTGNSSVLCNETGQYEPQPPECKIVTCEKPKVTNGRTSWDSENQPLYGDVIEYFCDKGYSLEGNSFIMCNENGQYDSQPPECKSDKDNFLVTKPHVSTATSTAESPTTSAKSSALRGTRPAEVDTTKDTGHSDIPTSRVKMTTSKLLSTSAPSLQETSPAGVDIHKDAGYAPVIISVLIVSIVVPLLVFSVYKYLLKRKGSYDTREDLKPELLRFQNL